MFVVRGQLCVVKKMEIQPIKKEKDYHATIREIESLFQAAPGTPEGDRLDVLTTLVEAYEVSNFSNPLARPYRSNSLSYGEPGFDTP
jgi:HTH-type transcriptional regulator/antitoxin HigA